MAGISRYEAAALGLTAAFVLFTAGWFFAGQTESEPYTVTVQQAAVSDASSSAAQPETADTQQPDSLLEGERIPVNTADVYELDRLPGIGQATLEGLLDYITLD